MYKTTYWSASVASFDALFSEWQLTRTRYQVGSVHDSDTDKQLAAMYTKLADMYVHCMATANEERPMCRHYKAFLLSMTGDLTATFGALDMKPADIVNRQLIRKENEVDRMRRRVNIAAEQ